MKIVFLDVDGVICNEATSYTYFDPGAMRRLNAILEATDAFIVVTSTWRLRNDLDDLRTLFVGGGNRYRNSDLPKPEPFDPGRILDRTANLNRYKEERRKEGLIWGRGHEISEWLRTCDLDIESYVVLDDDVADIFPHLKQLVRCETAIGLTDDNVKEAIEVLNRPLDVESNPDFIEPELYRQILKSIPIACVDVAIVDQGAVLLVKRGDDPAKGQWWLPGGRVLKGEKMATTARRKASEEVGIDCVVGPLIHTAETIFPDGPGGIDVHSINSCFLLYPKQHGELKVKLDSHHEEHRMISVIPYSFHPYVKECLKGCGLN